MPLNKKADSDLSVTRWLAELRAGDDLAATRLWKFLHRRLLSVSRVELGRSAHRSSYDEDDVAQSAFYSLCKALQNGRYEQLENREELWKILAVIAINKARNRARDQGRQKRGGDKAHVADGDPYLQGLVSAEFTVDEDLMMKEECERLLTLLQRDELKQVAILKVEGYTNEEIADRLRCSRRSVQRRLNLIRDLWSKELQ